MLVSRFLYGTSNDGEETALASSCSFMYLWLTCLPPFLFVTAPSLWMWLVTGVALDHRKCLVNARGDGDAHSHATDGQSRPELVPSARSHLRAARFLAFLWKTKLSFYSKLFQISTSFRCPLRV